MIKKSQNHDMKINSDASSQLKAGVYIAYASTIITILIQLVYTPIMIRVLGQEEYGLYSLVASVVSYLSLFNLGLTGAYLRFYSIYKTKSDEVGIARLNGMFLLMFSVLASLAVICGMTLSMFPEKIFGSKLSAAELKETQILMRILVVNIALTFPSGLFGAVVDANERFIVHRGLNLAGVVINPFLTLPLLLNGYGNVAMVTVTTLITVSKLLANIVYCVRSLDMKFRFDGIDWTILKEIGAFSFFLFLNMIIEQINWNVDKIILGRLAGTAVVAVYAVGSQMNMVFMDFLITIASVFSPRINLIAAQGNYKERFDEIFIRVGRIQFMVLGLLVSGFVIFGEYFITGIYVGTEYRESYYVTLLLLCPEMIALVQSVGIEMQRALNKHKFRSVVYLIMSVLNIFISIPLAHRWGATGCAAGTTISLLVAHGIIMNTYYHRAMKIDIKAFWLSILSLAKGLILPFIVGLGIMWYGVNNLISFLIFGSIYTVVYGVSMWILGMNESERRLFILSKRTHTSMGGE